MACRARAGALAHGRFVVSGRDVTGCDGTKSRSRNIFRMFVRGILSNKVTDIRYLLRCRGKLGPGIADLETDRHRAGSKQATRRSAAPSPFFSLFFFPG